LLLRKENFEISASYQLAPWQTPVATRAVVGTGAGPSVIREDMLPEGRTEYASRAPSRTQVSNASGQLLKVNAEVSLTIYVGGGVMEYEFLVVKALSVPLILVWDFQRNYVDTISPKTRRSSGTTARPRWRCGAGRGTHGPRPHAEETSRRPKLGLSGFGKR